MRRSSIFALSHFFVVALLPVSAWPQGAIIETLEELQNVPNPPEFRDVFVGEHTAARRSGRYRQLCVVGDDLWRRLAGGPPRRIGALAPASPVFHL